MEESIPKKKRGRKRGSKNKKVKGEEKTNLLNLNNKINNSTIIQLKNNINIEETDIITPYDKNDNINLLKETKCKVCWNCCHEFNKGQFGLPLKYQEGIFYIYGYFCSFECMYRFAYEKFNDKLNDINQLINLYHYHLYNEYSKCNIAPNKLLLNIFGGPLSIEEYRNTFDEKSNEFILTTPLIMPINHIIINNNNNKLIKKENLKLYRTKDIKNKGENINSYMN